MKYRYLSLLGILFLTCSCSMKNNDDTGGGNNPPPVETEETLLPKVGEVRKWFDHGTIGESNFYNYCPSIMMENNKKHIYYCSNKIEGNVTDYIAYREATYDKTWSYSDIEFLLEPTPDTWDQRHTCDPSVIKGEFKYGEETYNYMMAYLGCLTSDNSKNEVGIAVSKSPKGPWIKVNEINPLVPYDRELAAWGTGQPSIVSVDKKGKVILFYTVGNVNGSYTEAKQFDLSDLSKPQLLRTKKVPTFGILSHKNSYVITNASFAYDEVNKKIIMAKGRLPFGEDLDTPNFIADTIDVYYLDDSSSDNTSPFDEIFKGNNAGDWKLLGSIDEKLTSFKRNHNVGLVRDSYGRTLLNENKIEVAFTRSDLGSSAPWTYLSTYRIYSTSFALDYDK